MVRTARRKKFFDILLPIAQKYYSELKIVFFLCLVFDGRPRSKEAVTSAAGAVAGEPTNDGI